MGSAGDGRQVVFVRVGGLHVDHGVEEASSEADPQFGAGVQVFQRGLGVQEEDRVFLAGLGEWDVAGRQVAVGHFWKALCKWSCHKTISQLKGWQLYAG